MNQYQTEEDVMLEEVLTDLHEIVLHNDDYNTFEHVIDCLMKHCGHKAEQAEQCAYIVHYNGKCSVKRGELTSLIPIKEALQNEGLSVGVE